MSDTDPDDPDDPDDAAVPPTPGQERPAGPGAESMDPGDDDAEVASPSEMAGHDQPDA